MKTEKTLEKKLNDAETNLAGVENQLKPYKMGAAGYTFTGAPEDIESLETEKYQIVASKWEEHSWSEYGGGIEWKEWLSLHYRERESEGEIKCLKTDKIVTRHMSDGNKDKNHLWPYDYVKVEALGPTQVEASWVDEDGNKGPTYKIDLE